MNKIYISPTYRLAYNMLLWSKYFKCWIKSHINIVYFHLTLYVHYIFNRFWIDCRMHTNKSFQLDSHQIFRMCIWSVQFNRFAVYIFCDCRNVPYTLSISYHLCDFVQRSVLRKNGCKCLPFLKNDTNDVFDFNLLEIYTIKKWFKIGINTSQVSWGSRKFLYNRQCFCSIMIAICFFHENRIL